MSIPIGSARTIQFDKFIDNHEAKLVRFDFDFLFDNPFGTENFIEICKFVD